MSNRIQPRVDGGVDIAVAEAVLAKARLIKKGTAQDGLVYAGAGETPIGATLTAAAAIGDEVEYSQPGAENWVYLTAAGVIAAGAEFKVAADGKIAAKVSAAEDSAGILHPRQVAAAEGDLVIGRLFDRPMRYPAAADAETIHTLNVTAPVAGDDESVLTYEHSDTTYRWAKAITDADPASQARGDIFYRNATVFARLAASIKGMFLMTGGSGADPSYGHARLVRCVGPLADQGAAATVTVKLGKPETGRAWIPLRLQVLSGTTADATAELFFAGTTALAAPFALDGDAETSTFADASCAAGQAVTVNLVTDAGTGDLDAAILFFEYADVPA